ncbi:hypothetical protein [Streptomyces cinereoruber]|uniref:hypothetical protein n=1 Tax=Streptomyces cinereoruber TaxID=67260 RepID=UPI003644F736
MKTAVVTEAEIQVGYACMDRDHFAALYPGSTTHRELEAEVVLRRKLLPRLPTRAELDACRSAARAAS